VQNYGLAIIVLTFLIKMLLYPLTYTSMKSMSKIAKLQPQLNALREKYKDDREKLNVEMMNFMKTNGYNPVGGCLPILIQMPIFFALYRVLFNSMELYQAPFFGWIQDLSSPDPFFITPVLLCGLMYLQQKISPSTATDPMQQKMLQIMPVLFGVFMLLLPAGLNIYMVVNSAVSIAQQYFLNKKLGLTPLANTTPAKV
jgi:YidC/Oxa1 family membrane protein insertase